MKSWTLIVVAVLAVTVGAFSAQAEKAEPVVQELGIVPEVVVENLVISGLTPKVGELVEVIDFTYYHGENDPTKFILIWTYVSQDEKPIGIQMVVAADRFGGLNEDGFERGIFLVERDTETGIRFVSVTINRGQG